MPLPDCPITEKELAEFSLGEERSRLAEDRFLAVSAHVAGCRPCQRAYAEYLRAAQRPRAWESSSPEDPGDSMRGYVPVADVDRVAVDTPDTPEYRAELAQSGRNVETRLRALLRMATASGAAAPERAPSGLHVQEVERDRPVAAPPAASVPSEPRDSDSIPSHDMAMALRAWRRRALGFAGVAAVFGGVILTLWLSSTAPATAARAPATVTRTIVAEGPTPRLTPGIDPAFSETLALAGGGQGTGIRQQATGDEPGGPFIPLESPERESWIARVREAATPEAKLAVLTSWREELGRYPRLPERDLVDAVELAERLLWPARGTDVEAKAFLYIARRQAELGQAAAWQTAFLSYALRRGDLARKASRNAGESRAATEYYGRTAEATAYYDEVLRLFRRKDYTSSLALAERLLALYPDKAKAYEGQIVAARCHLEVRQISGAVDAYLAVVRHCPDEAFAQKTAKTLLVMLGKTRRGEEGIAIARELRARFHGDDFHAYTLYREGEWLARKGTPYYLQATAVLQEVVRLTPDSWEGVAASNLIRQLQNSMLDALRPEAGVFAM